MRLYVMRHGPAEDRAPTGRDSDRALTRPGREVVLRAARALHEVRAAAPLRVISSPYRRAHETAELVATHFGVEPEIHPDLASDAAVPLDLAQRVHASGGDAILIGHQPIVEELVRLLVDPAPAPPLPAGFRTATIVALESTDDCFRLTTVIDPHAAC